MPVSIVFWVIAAAFGGLAGLLLWTDVFSRVKNPELPGYFFAIVSGAMILGGLAANAGMIKIGEQAAAQPQQPAYQQPAAPEVSVAGKTCVRQSDGTNTLKVAVKNILSTSTADYNAENVWATVGGSPIANITTASGSVTTFASLDVDPCITGELIVLSDGRSGSIAWPFDSFKDTQTIEIPATDNGDLIGVAFSATYGGDSTVDSNGTGATLTSTTKNRDIFVLNTTLGTGGSKIGYIDVATNGSAQFGNSIRAPLVDAVTGQQVMRDGVPQFTAIPNPAGILAAMDFRDSTIFSNDQGFSMNSVTSGIIALPAACPSEIVRAVSADVCYTMRSIKGTDGDVRFSYTLRSDLGNPGDSGGDNPKLTWYDQGYFQDNDGSIKLGYVSSTGTNQNMPLLNITWVTA